MKIALSKKYKIVIVEDDPMLLKYISSSFKAEKDFDVFTASDGEEGEKLIIECVPDLVLLDIIMPKKNGFEVLEAVRKNSSTAKVPVIVLSNLMQQSDIEQAKKLGATDYLVKVDLEVREIIDKVKKFFTIV